MQDFTKLRLWQKAHELTLAIYKNTEAFPREEMFGMRRQLRDAATSVESNIAEGCGRRTEREFLNFLGMASGSLSELQCRLISSHDLGWIPDASFRGLISQIIAVRKMNWSLQQRLGGRKDTRPAGIGVPAENGKRGGAAADATESERSERLRASKASD